MLIEDTKLKQIEQALRDYHLALDLREHGGSAAHHFVDRCQKILEMPWKQGEEETRRAKRKDLTPKG